MCYLYLKSILIITKQKNLLFKKINSSSNNINEEELLDLLSEILIDIEEAEE